MLNAKQSTSVKAPGVLEDSPDLATCKGGGLTSWVCVWERRTEKANFTTKHHHHANTWGSWTRKPFLNEQNPQSLRRNYESRFLIMRNVATGLNFSATIKYLVTSSGNQ